MHKAMKKSLILVLGVVLGAVFLKGCQCNPAHTCDVAADCLGQYWEAGDCTEEDGYWVCSDHRCEARCGKLICESSFDCLQLSWPDDMGCDSADGVWDCVNGDCMAFCNDPQCEQDSDCASKAWPPDAGCSQEEGRWTCWRGACTATCVPPCESPEDCASSRWREDCSGHWDCVSGDCTEVCDETSCGDDQCNAVGGETRASCPQDCGIVCVLAMDCTGSRWDLDCDGHWDCIDTVCVGVCDYGSCGDGVCDNNQGESRQSCPTDCMTDCQAPSDCVHRDWTKLCQGVWVCSFDGCEEFCDSNHCGDGVCSPNVGESGASCYKDCHAGACNQVADCIGRDWLGDCPGHWSCDAASGSCRESCDIQSCGDGHCDFQGGEDANSCPNDCDAYRCLTDSDCSEQAVPEGCSSFSCVRKVCWPLCP